MKNQTELELKDVFAPDVHKIRTWKPNDPFDVFFLLELSIGTTIGEGADLFSVFVATPQGLSRKKNMSIKKIVVLQEYSWESLYQKLLDIIESSAEDSWEGSVENLQKYFDWEYQGYK